MISKYYRWVEIVIGIFQLTTTYNLAYPRVSAYLLPALTAVLEVNIILTIRNQSISFQKVVSMPNIPAKPMVIGSFISKVKGIYSDIIATHESRPEI